MKIVHNNNKSVFLKNQAARRASTKFLTKVKSANKHETSIKQARRTPIVSFILTSRRNGISKPMVVNAVKATAIWAAVLSPALILSVCNQRIAPIKTGMRAVGASFDKYAQPPRTTSVMALTRLIKCGFIRIENVN